MTQTQTTAQTATDRIVSQIAETGEQTAREIAYAAEVAAEQIGEAKAKARALVQEELQGFKEVITGAREFATDLLDELAHDLHAFLGEVLSEVPAQPEVSQPAVPVPAEAPTQPQDAAQAQVSPEPLPQVGEKPLGQCAACGCGLAGESAPNKFCAECYVAQTSETVIPKVQAMVDAMAEGAKDPHANGSITDEVSITTAALPSASVEAPAPIYPVALPVSSETQPTEGVSADTGAAGQQNSDPVPTVPEMPLLWKAKRLTVTALLSLANERGVDVPAEATKHEILSALGYDV